MNRDTGEIERKDTMALNSLHCGACRTTFDTGDQLRAHLGECEAVKKALRELVGSNDGLVHCDACGSTYIKGAMCHRCYGRWQDDGGRV